MIGTPTQTAEVGAFVDGVAAGMACVHEVGGAEDPKRAVLFVPDCAAD
jgi:hypothetical protein